MDCLVGILAISAHFWAFCHQIHTFERSEASWVSVLALLSPFSAFWVAVIGLSREHSNVTVLAEARLGADSQEPFVQLIDVSPYYKRLRRCPPTLSVLMK